MRILLEPTLAVGDADQPQQFERPGARLRFAHLEMDEQRLHDLLSDRQDRIERGHRLLEDHGDVAPAHLAHCFVGQIEQVAALEQDAAGGDACRCSWPSSRMMASEDTDLPQPDSPTIATALAGVDGVGNAVDRPHDAA